MLGNEEWTWERWRNLPSSEIFGYPNGFDTVPGMRLCSVLWWLSAGMAGLSWDLLREMLSSFWKLAGSLITQGQRTHQLLSIFYLLSLGEGWCIRARHPRQWWGCRKPKELRAFLTQPELLQCCGEPYGANGLNPGSARLPGSICSAFHTLLDELNNLLCHLIGRCPFYYLFCIWVA